MNQTTLQFLRKCTLVVSQKSGESLDLSLLRIKFAVKRSGTATPNMADIRVYNLDVEDAAEIKKEYTTVVLQAGYNSNFGVIFSGNIKQCILGRESATDTFLDIIAGDGDQAYNFAIVNTTLKKGSTPDDQLAAATKPMADMDVTVGHVDPLNQKSLPRGKVMYGSARDHIDAITGSSQAGWSIQDGQIQVIKQTTYLPGERVILTSKTGLIGTPEQTNQGVNMKCLLNPRIKINTLVQIDNASVQQMKIDLAVPGNAANIPAPLTEDGTYAVLTAEHMGDTRGQDWSTSIISLNVDVTTNPLNAITIGGGGSL